MGSIRGVWIVVAVSAVLAWLPASGAEAGRTCGSWQVLPSPNGGSNDSSLSGVSADARDDAWAVGTSSETTVTRILAEHWDGSSWTVVPTPNPSPTISALTAVATGSAVDTWAVGFYDDGSTFRTLAEHWDGFSWSVVPTPNVGAGENVLTSVTFVADGDAWAVGYRRDSAETPRQTLALHWNGSVWSVVTTPNGTGDNYLWSVRGLSSGDVWAVGSYSVPWFQTLTEHWDGSSWTVVPSQNLGNGDNVLYAAVPLTASSAVAVGTWLNGNQQATLAEHWQGSTWKAGPSPSPGGYLNFLTGAASGGTAGIWAVGWGADIPFGVQRNLAEHWNGHRWTVGTIPNVGSGSNELAAVVGVPSTGVFFAVGHHEQIGGNHTLVEYRC